MKHKGNIFYSGDAISLRSKVPATKLKLRIRMPTGDFLELLCLSVVPEKTTNVWKPVSKETTDDVNSEKPSGARDQDLHVDTSGYTWLMTVSIMAETRSISL